MNNEQKIIKQITSILPKSKFRINKCFESDSEIIKFEDNYLLFTIDEFSSEDMMRENDPYILGWNAAVGGISDIFACGGIPLFYAHSLIIDKDWDEEYIKRFSLGVADVLKRTKTAFMGGDFGRCSQWRYTVSVIGKINGKPVTRKGAKPGDAIYISGKIGMGNLEAGLKIYSEVKLSNMLGMVKNKFKIRMAESLFIKEYATSCIDTSDGVFQALNTISQINETGYVIDNIHYIKEGLLLTKFLSVSPILLFLSECGEYELLFTIREKDEEEFLQKAKEKKLSFYKLGQITSSKSKIISENAKELNLTDFDINARDYDNIKDYLNEIIEKIRGY